MGDLHWPLAMYKGEISHLDAQLSQVFALDRVASGLIALVGDHGESLGEREIYFNHRSLYVTLHVPLLLAGAGVPVGLQSDRPVTHLDLGRTLLDLSSMEDASFPGRNLIRQATDPTDHDRPRYAVEGYGESASVTVAGLHLILNLKEKDDRFTGEARERHEVELYDLDRDRRCDVNLVQTRVEDARRLRRLLVAWLLDAVEEDWAHERVTDRAAIEALQEMGYLESSLARSEAFWVPDDCRWCERFGDRP